MIEKSLINNSITNATYSKEKVGFGDVLILLLIIFISPETLFFGTNLNRFWAEIIQKYFPLVLLFVLLIKLQKGYVCGKKQRVLLFSFFTILSICVVISGIYNNNLIIGYGLRILLIGTGFLFVTAFTTDRFMYIFEKIIYVITIYSLLLYFIGFFAPSVLTLFPVTHNTMSLSFYNAVLCVIPSWGGDATVRLWGPFREPGVFQMYINLAVLFYIKLNNKLSFKRAVIYILALFLTYSTTGYIVLLFTLLYFALENDVATNKRQKKLLVFFISISLIILSLETTLFTYDSFVFGKLFNEDSHSGIARFASIYGNLSIFSKSPVFGVGITNLDEMFISYCTNNYSFANKSNTSTIFVPFATFGFLYGVLWIIALVSFFKSFSVKTVSMICVCMAGILSFMGENLVENVLVYILLGYGIINLTIKNELKG